MVSENTYVACIPCYNNAKTVGEVAAAIRLQTPSPTRIVLLDDASTDDSCAKAVKLDLDVISMEGNCGRGAVRARAVDACNSELLLSCDATLAVASNFYAKALNWFSDARVAAVFGCVIDPKPYGVAGRWRARHLFLQDELLPINEHSLLSTGAFVSRSSIIREVGNFNRNLRYKEDAELGYRLLAGGWKVVYEPACVSRPLTQNTVGQCLERHWRWYVANGYPMSLATLKSWIGLSVRTMAKKDLKAKDPVAACVSLILPWHHWSRSRRETRSPS